MFKHRKNNGLGSRAGTGQQLGQRRQLGARTSCSVPEPFFDVNVFFQGYKGTGNHVQSLQWYLSEWGYLGSYTNGRFDDATTQAVRDFQRDAGAEVDGKVGRETRGKLCDAVENWTAHGDPFDYPTDEGPGGGSGGSGGGSDDSQGDAGASGGSSSGASDRWPYVAAAGALGVSALVYAARKSAS